MTTSTSRLRRAVTALAASSLLVGVAPLAAVAATPSSRDITDFACPSAEVPDPGFTDDDATVHHDAIACIVWYELAGGTTKTTYGPEQDVRRDQMASFLANLLKAAEVTLPSNPPDAFVDDETSVHELAINQLAALGVVNGTSATTYSPSDSVRRDQMATFLNNAYEEIVGSRLTSTQDYFTDDGDSVHEDNINAVAAAGLAAGKTSTTYAPLDPVQRDQMASFLARETDLLVEKGEIAKPESLPADVILAAQSVAQGGLVKGTIDTDEGVTVTSASVSGCGLSSRALALSGTDHAFEFSIPVTQPTGDCTLTFTIKRDGGADVTDKETVKVTPATSATDAPELVSVSKVGETADGVTLRFTFDEPLANLTPNKAAFRLYDSNATQSTASSATRGSDTSTVEAVFTAGQYASATTATVAAAAVEDGSSVANAEGAVPLVQPAVTLDGTDAPDLTKVERQPSSFDFVFTYDEAIVSHPGSASDYHLVFADGSTAAGSELVTVDNEPATQRTVRFADFGTATPVRGWVDAETVSDAEQDGLSLNGVEGNANPTEAEDIGAGGGDSPYLVKVVINAPDNTVAYTFNRGVTLVSKNPTDGNVFVAYDAEGDEVSTNSATVSGATVTATFSGSSDPITATTVGAAVRDNAVKASSGTQRINRTDEQLPDTAPTVPGNTGGETAAPDLQSVKRSISGSNSVLTFTFDAPVSTATPRSTSDTLGDVVIYQRNGQRTELDLNDTSGNECTVSDNTVTCSAASTSALGQLIDSATLGAVEVNTVGASSSPTSARNYEASAPIAG